MRDTYVLITWPTHCTHQVVVMSRGDLLSNLALNVTPPYFGERKANPGKTVLTAPKIKIGDNESDERAEFHFTMYVRACLCNACVYVCVCVCTYYIVTWCISGIVNRWDVLILKGRILQRAHRNKIVELDRTAWRNQNSRGVSGSKCFCVYSLACWLRRFVTKLFGSHIAFYTVEVLLVNKS